MKLIDRLQVTGYRLQEVCRRLKKSVTCPLSPANCNLGFTLIEALVGLAIVGVVGFILSDLLSQTFRGSNKSQLIGVIKQNGQSALNSIDDSIRTSDKIICINKYQGTGNNTTITVSKFGNFIRFTFYLEDAVGVNNNGYITKDNLTVENPVTPPNRYCTNYSSAGEFSVLEHTILTDIDPLTGVSVKTGQFIKGIAQAGFKDIVTVEFELGPARLLTGGFDRQVAGGKVKFTTTVEQR